MTHFPAILFAAILAANLPTFDDFRRIDRTRRLVGQMQTAELLEVNQISADLIRATAGKYSNDVQVLHGAAELMVTWPEKRTLFDQAIAVAGSNNFLVSRYACAAFRHGDLDRALALARQAQVADNDNTVPWLVELAVHSARQQAAQFPAQQPIFARTYRDYSSDAIRARTKLLEKAGYSAYSARRLAFKPDSDALTIVRDLAKPPVAETVRPLLTEAAAYLQQRRAFLLTEMVGQTIERSTLIPADETEPRPAARYRLMEMDKRREELKALLADVERNAVDFASEEQMVAYFDEVLALGEEAAMKGLLVSVRHEKPATPPASPSP